MKKWRNDKNIDQQPRVWVNDCFQVHDFATHEKEIDDIDFSPDSARLLSVSKDKVRYYLWSKIPSIAFAEGHSLGREEGEEARWAWLGESCWRKICFQGLTLSFLKLLTFWGNLYALIFISILLRGWSLGVWRETWGNTKCSRLAIQWDRARCDKKSRKIAPGSFIS